MHKLLNFIVLLMLNKSICCQIVSFSDAQACAVNYAGELGLQNHVVDNYVLYGTLEEPKIFVFNLQSQDWVMVSGDYSTVPILAYGIGETFDTTGDFPDALKMIVEDFIMQIDCARANIRGSNNRNEEWDRLLSSSVLNRNSYNPGVNLLDNNEKRGAIRWRQRKVNNSEECLGIAYNKYVPTGNPFLGQIEDCECDLPPAGCGPVAMGEVMWYWQWPKESPIPYRNGYNWNLMPGRIYYTTNWQEADEIAFLLKDLGNVANSFYTCKGTFTLEGEFCSAWSEFGYKSVTSAYRRDWNYGYSWIELIRSEIDNERPVIVCGYKPWSLNGHYFVVDGYQEEDVDMFHLNLGWGDRQQNVYVHLYDIVFDGHNYDRRKVAFVGISPTYSDTLVNKTFYERLVKTDYEISLQDMSIPANDAVLVVDSGAQLQLIAGREIVLRPGFTASRGSDVSIVVEDDLINHMPIIVTSWPTTVEEESDGLYVDVKNANSYSLTVKDIDGNVKYQTAGLVRDIPARIWCSEYDYDPLMTYDCTVRFKNNFGRTLLHTFRINEDRMNSGEMEQRLQSMKQAANHDSLHCYPNPASGWVTVELGNSGNYEITLYNAKGQPCLHDVNIDNAFYYLDASIFPSGVYFLSVRNGECVRNVQLLIK